jgi:O-antigen/teichoic acid export membrane protein
MMIVEQLYLRYLKRDYFLTNSFFNLLNTLAVTGLGFLFWWASARFYSSYVLGEFVVVISAAQLITTIANVGLSYSIIRYLPVTCKEMKNEILNSTITIVVLFLVILSTLVLFLARLISPTFISQNINGQLFLFFVVSLGLYQLMSPILAVLRSGYMLLSTSVVTGICRILVMISLSLKFNNSQMLLIAFALPTCLACLILLYMVIPNILYGYSFSPRLDFKVLKSIRKYSLLSYVSNVLHDLPYQLFPQYISNQIGPASAAYFYIAWNFFNLITTLGNSISLSMFVEGSYRVNKVYELTRKNVIAVILLTGTIALTIFLLANPLLLLFGKAYANHGSSFLRIIAIASIPAAIVYSLIAYLRIKMFLFPVIIAFAIIAAIPISFSEFQMFHNLTEVGFIWGVSQFAGLTFLLGYIGWHNLFDKQNQTHIEEI